MRVALLYTGHPNANLVRPQEIGRFLEARGHEVVAVDLLGFAHDRYLRLRERLAAAMGKVGLGGEANLADAMRGWADVIQRKVLDRERFDAVICEYFLHAYVLTRDLPCVKIYDCPTPAVDELEFSGEFGQGAIDEMREMEMDIYRSSDHVLFHWKSYENFVRDRWYDGDNMTTLTYGCYPKEVRARFGRPPKAVYLGYLGGYWSNMELLAALSRNGACGIDVWGFPRPGRDLGLNYRGFAGDTDVMARYQLGLVTCSRDVLRCEGFSAKHLEYISYGLPVLVPEWRRHLELIKGSVPFNEETFPAVVEGLADEDEWTRMSDLAYGQAQELTWDRTLEGLDRMVAGG